MSLFERIHGQDRTLSILQHAVQENRFAQSYLFHGPRGVGKFTAALYFGMALNCHASKDRRPCGTCPSCRKFLSFTHPDFIYIFPTPNLNITPEGEIKNTKMLAEYQSYIDNRRDTPWKEFFFSSNVEIRRDMILMLQHWISMSPNEGRYKIYIIENADLLNISASNTFLKTLEEPPPDTVIILTTTKPDSLLPTIRSRCQKIAFQAVPRTDIEKILQRERALDGVEAKTYARIANGNVEKALQLIEDGGIELRKVSLDFMEILAANDDLAMIDFLRHQRGKLTQGALSDFISYVNLWLGDIANYKNNPSDIANIDKSELFDFFYRRKHDVDEQIGVMVQYLDELKRRVEGHVNPTLILIELYQYLSHQFGFHGDSTA